jgi:diacylglycerol kinase (ATP)
LRVRTRVSAACGCSGVNSLLRLPPRSITSARRQEVALAAFLLPVACLVDVSAAERVLLFASVLFVLVVELLNSSVEAAIDRIGFDTHRLSKRAKDLGSAAVLIALIMLMTTWGLIAVPSLVQLGQSLLSPLR